jgi:hypothetical protein
MLKKHCCLSWQRSLAHHPAFCDAAVVEVHLEVHYKASFGSQLAVVGSHTGWLTSAAVPMTCGGAEADTWTVVLSLPYG